MHLSLRLVATMRGFKSLFHPSSIAVVGASTNSAKLGHAIVRSLCALGYRGRVYAVNPKLAGQKLLGCEAYAKVSDIPDELDLAIVSVGAASSIQVLRECAARGVKSAVVLSAGFSESFGDEGRRMELEIRRIAEESGMAVVGPNCQGIVSVSEGIYTFPEIEACGGVGEISAILHSGSLTAALVSIANKRGFYLNKAVSTGNEAASTLNDFLEYFLEDPETKVIALYIEQVRDGRRFMELCKSAGKPIVALKVGRSEAGRLAAKSHTAALAGSIEVWNAVCRQAGVIQASTFEELYDLSMALAAPMQPRGNRVGIVTSPGGPSVIAADMCGELGLAVPRLSRNTVEELRRVLPSYAAVANPVDMTASALEDLSLYRQVLSIVASDGNVDALLVIALLMNHSTIARAIAEAAREIDKPIVVVWMSFFREDDLLEAVKILGERRIPNYFGPERAVKAISSMVQQARYADRKRMLRR
ncbi:MAG: CoA-binding protein [Candidatus Nezhaarchaeota archaeon]|nr:CoA-binding protein [Candidatus Nezhaarchaeota archaeon]